MARRKNRPAVLGAHGVIIGARHAAAGRQLQAQFELHGRRARVRDVDLGDLVDLGRLHPNVRTLAHIDFHFLVDGEIAHTGFMLQQSLASMRGEDRDAAGWQRQAEMIRRAVDRPQQPPCRRRGSVLARRQIGIIHGDDRNTRPVEEADLLGLPAGHGGAVRDSVQLQIAELLLFHFLGHHHRAKQGHGGCREGRLRHRI